MNIFLQVSSQSHNEWIYPLVVSTIVTIVLSIMIWSLNRNIAKNDQDIKENADRQEKDFKAQEVIISRMKDELNNLKDKISENNNSTNSRIYEMAAKISRDLNELSIKIAEMKRDDNNHSK